MNEKIKKNYDLLLEYNFDNHTAITIAKSIHRRGTTFEKFEKVINVLFDYLETKENLDKDLIVKIFTENPECITRETNNLTALKKVVENVCMLKHLNIFYLITDVTDEHIDDLRYFRICNIEDLKYRPYLRSLWLEEGLFRANNYNLDPNDSMNKLFGAGDENFVNRYKMDISPEIMEKKAPGYEETCLFYPTYNNLKIRYNSKLNELKATVLKEIREYLAIKKSL